MLKLIYTFFLGILIAIFIGMGIETFYGSPKAPEYPPTLQESKESDSAYNERQNREQRTYDKRYESFTQKQETYNRNVAIIALVFAIALLAISLVLHPRMDVISDGLLLGGVFTLLYSVGRSMASNNPKVSFVVVSVGLLVTLFMGYRKFALTNKVVNATKK